MLLVGKTFDANYRYGFNGKEHDTDPYGQGNIYDYGFRIYNPRIGKFLSVDPLFREYAWNSTYSFAENDVIRCIDIEGKEKWVVNDGNGGETFVYGPFKNQEAAQLNYDTYISVYGVEFEIPDDGMLENQKVTVKRIEKLEKGPISNSIEGIVLHRTVSSTAKSTLNSFESRGVGTHFLVGTDGTIYQTASLNQRTAHLRESQLKDWAPRNRNSIGIEVVGNYNYETETWDPLTPEQIQSVSWLTNSLIKTYDLRTVEVYCHEDIQPKTRGEGRVVHDAIKANLINTEIGPLREDGTF